MTAPSVDNVVTLPKGIPGDRLAVAATRLYDADVALHIARQTGVDAWVAAAYDRLHVAVREHRAALAAEASIIRGSLAHRRCAS